MYMYAYACTIIASVDYIHLQGFQLLVTCRLICKLNVYPDFVTFMVNEKSKVLWKNNNYSKFAARSSAVSSSIHVWTVSNLV